MADKRVLTVLACATSLTLSACEPHRPPSPPPLKADAAVVTPAKPGKPATPGRPVATAIAAPAGEPNLVVLLSGRGPYELGLASGGSVTPTQIETGRLRAALHMPAPQGWRTTYSVEVRNPGAGPVARLMDTRYGFLKMEPRTLDIGTVQAARCENTDYVEARRSGLDYWVRSAMFWRARVEACQGDPRSSKMLHALQMTLGAEKMLVQAWPDRFAVSQDIRSLAKSVTDDNPLCKEGSRSQYCSNLLLEMRETRYLNYKLYIPLSALNAASLTTLSKRELTDALTALHEANSAYQKCQEAEDSVCDSAEFAVLEQSFCDEAKSRKMPAMKACAAQEEDAEEEEDLSVPAKGKKKKLPKTLKDE